MVKSGEQVRGNRVPFLPSSIIPRWMQQRAPAAVFAERRGLSALQW
jgi:hypothetical protein